ncbi:hypothetical protein [Massilia aerilata]|uniref:Uncharacterized protein n=1 Tax=Massilia aerilata TaxID=453817 RepID=A0ABW0S5Z0_9BURK
MNTPSPRLKLVNVRDPGTENERVMMRAVDDLDLGNYIVTDTTYNQDGTVSNKVRHVYEFAPKNIKKGDYVVLRSKAGKYKLGTLDDNVTPLHYLYWGLNYTIWNEDGDNAWLLFAQRNLRQSVAVAPSK